MNTTHTALVLSLALSLASGVATTAAQADDPPTAADLDAIAAMLRDHLGRPDLEVARPRVESDGEVHVDARYPGEDGLLDTTVRRDPGGSWTVVAQRPVNPVGDAIERALFEHLRAAACCTQYRRRGDQVDVTQYLLRAGRITAVLRPDGDGWRVVRVENARDRGGAAGDAARTDAAAAALGYLSRADARVESVRREGDTAWVAVRLRHPSGEGFVRELTLRWAAPGHWVVVETRNPS